MEWHNTEASFTPPLRKKNIWQPDEGGNIAGKIQFIWDLLLSSAFGTAPEEVPVKPNEME